LIHAGLRGLCLQVIAPQRDGHVGHAHGGAGVTGVGLLDSVHGQRADRVGHLLGVCHVGRLRKMDQGNPGFYRGWRARTLIGSSGALKQPYSVLLAESHLCVHTWPEQRAVTLDVYVCNFGGDRSARAQALLEAMVALFRSGHVERRALQRGHIG
jgi:hypothetical protein